MHVTSILMDPASLLLALIQPLVFTAVALLAAGDHAVPAGGRAAMDTSQIPLAVGLLSLWATSLWSAGLILQFEIWEDTLESLLVRPCNLVTVLCGKVLGATTTFATLIAVSVAGVAWALGSPLEVAHPVQFVLALLLTVASTAALGGLVGCLFVMTRAAIRVAEALTYPLFIVGGLLIPLTLLPGWLRPVAWLMSPFWGKQLLGAAAAGEDTQLGAWAALAALAVVYALAAVLLFRSVVDRARRTGTLGHR